MAGGGAGVAVDAAVVFGAPFQCGPIGAQAGDASAETRARTVKASHGLGVLKG
jgi:hypothetical protein